MLRTDRGSLPLAMLLALVGVGLTGLIGTAVLGQVTTSRYDGDRAAAMDAAQSGIETGLAQMRALPTDTNDDALLASLPCVTTSTTSPDLTIAGDISPATKAAFSLNIYYVSQAPPATSDAEAWARTNRIGCIAAGPASAPTLQVELKATEGSTTFPHGACLQAVNTNGKPVVFADCDTTKTNLTQVWSLNNRDNFEGTTDGKTNDGKCFNVDWTKYKTFFPDASAGTGAAGPATRQLVNYDEFGRCLDVTGNAVGSAFLVIFPCKQTPDPLGIQWNQVWYLPTVTSGQTSGTGWLTLIDNTGKTYCLTSPGSTAAGQYARIYVCTPVGTPPANQTWTRRVFTGVNQTSYRIESTFGTTANAAFCLLPSPTDYWDQFTAMKISKLVLAPCDGTNLQKWNASPSILTSVVSDYREK